MLNVLLFSHHCYWSKNIGFQATDLNNQHRLTIAPFGPQENASLSAAAAEKASQLVSLQSRCAAAEQAAAAAAERLREAALSLADSQAAKARLGDENAGLKAKLAESGARERAAAAELAAVVEAKKEGDESLEALQVGGYRDKRKSKRLSGFARLAGLLLRRCLFCFACVAGMAVCRPACLLAFDGVCSTHPTHIIAALRCPQAAKSNADAAAALLEAQLLEAQEALKALDKQARGRTHCACFSLLSAFQLSFCSLSVWRCWLL